MCLDECGRKKGTCACNKPAPRKVSPDNINMIYECPVLLIDEYGREHWIFPSDLDDWRLVPAVEINETAQLMWTW